MSQYCPDCGRVNRDSAKFCRSCGENLSPGALTNIPLLENRYIILNTIKSGAMGCVYKAEDTRLNNIVAIKQLLFSVNNPDELKYREECFEAESLLLSRLHHSGLPKIIDYFVTKDPLTQKDACCLVMTHIEGKDLETIIIERNKCPFTIDEALIYTKQILDILKYLHSQSPPVIYRDLKPSNIMVDKSNLYLVDFGIARFFTPQRKGTAIGTPGYAAPEQYKGAAEPRSDLYSLGVLMHFLLTGKDPEDNLKSLFTFDPPERLNAQVPEYLDRIVMSMLDVIPGNRPVSADSIIQMLNNPRQNSYSYTGIAPLITNLPSLPGSSQVSAGFRGDYSQIFKSIRSYDINGVVTALFAGTDVNVRGFDGSTPLHIATEKGAANISALLIDKGADVNVRTNTGWTPLHYTAVIGDSITAELLISKGSEVDARNPDDITPLHRAAYWGQSKVAEILIRNGAEISRREKDGATPLHRASERGYEETVTLLLSKGADVNARHSTGCTPLHGAVGADSLNVTEILITCGADINAKNNNGATPLHKAAQNGQMNIAVYLMENGANINARDNDERTPLHMAAKRAQVDMVKLLISRGAEINAMDKELATPLKAAELTDIPDRAVVNTLRGHGGYSNIFDAAKDNCLDMIKSYLQSGVEVNSKNDQDETPLHIASASGRTRAIELLLSEGADLEINDRDGMTSLHRAVKKGHTHTVELLISKGADVNTKNNEGWTPLHTAVKEGHIKIIELILSNGTDVNSIDINGSTPLHIAASKNQRGAAELLLSHNAKINIKDNECATPLYWADLLGRNEMAQFLREKGGYRDIIDAIENNDMEEVTEFLNKKVMDKSIDKDDMSPLKKAIQMKNHECAELLISKGASVNRKDKMGETSLHHAVCNGDQRMLELLISHGAAINAKNSSGQTPLYKAECLGHREAADFLRSNGGYSNIVEAIRKDDAKEVADFMCNGVDVNAPDGYGSTPLHLAIEKGNIELVELLISRGADINCRNNKGWMPIKIAKEAGCREIVCLLAKLGAKGSGLFGLW